MARGRRKLWAWVLLLSFAAASFSALLRVSEQASASSTHAPILIQSNADFVSTNGVTGGTGTPSDPYVISGWDINASAAVGITIQDTSAYFTVRDSHVHATPGTSTGIYLLRVSNGLVANVTVENAAEGIHLEETENVDVRNSTVAWSDTGIAMVNGTDSDISGNLLRNDPKFGISVDAGPGVNVTNNVVVGGGETGILQSNHPGARIEGNRVSDNAAYGVHILQAWDILVANNTFVNNSNGARFFFAANSTLTGNLMFRNQDGARVEGSTGILVFHNDFIDNGLSIWGAQASDGGASSNRWDDGYPVGGNYWSNSVGGDNCSGPAQNICPSPDGIGDTKYVIRPPTFDNYPLMQHVHSGDFSPFAAFTVTPASGDVTTSFSVDANESSDVEDATSALQVRWDWESDGTWDTSWSTAKVEAHSYTTAGSHTIRLQVQDTGGMQDNATRVVSLADLPPTAAFTVSPATPGVGVPVTFDASASSDPEDPPTALQVRWDWEGNGTWDSGWSTEKTANHVFGSAGTYVVHLQVRDSVGQITETTGTVVVSLTAPSPLPVAIILLPVVVVALLVLYLAMRRRRKKPAPAVPDHSSIGP